MFDKLVEIEQNHMHLADQINDPEISQNKINGEN